MVVTPPPGAARGRVVHVMEAFIGGTARHLTDLVCGETNWEHSVILSLEREPRMAARADQLRESGIRVDVVPMKRRLDPVADWQSFRQIVRLLRSIRPDIVHCHSAKGGFLGRAAGLAAGVPVRLYTPHALPFHANISRLSFYLYRGLERLAGRWSTGIIAVSPSEADAVRNARLIHPSRIRVIPNGVELPAWGKDKEAARRQLNLPADRPVVLCIAHLRPQKAPLDWLKMARQVHRERPDCFFVWVGDGPLRETALKAARSLGDSFCYLGYQEDPSVAHDAADVFTLSSLWEGCPYTLLDAMARETPCAVTAVAGCRDAIQSGQNGLLSPPGDPSALARNVLQLLNQPQSAAEMGRLARQTIQQNFSLEGFLAQHDGVYREMVELG